MLRKVSEEEIIERLFKLHKNKIHMIEYGGGSTQKSVFECYFGHRWSAVTFSVSSAGNGCPECRNKKIGDRDRYSYEKVVSIIEATGNKVLELEYENSKNNRILISFSCGHICETTFESFQMGSRCSICGKEKATEAHRKRALEKIKIILEENNFTFVSFPNGYENRNSIINFICPDGHSNSYKVREFYKNHNCTQCTKERISDYFSGSGSTNWKGGITPLYRNLRKFITKWKKDSIKNSGYKCVITGDRFDVIHHLYGFDKIVEEVFSNLSLQIYSDLSQYTDKELNKIKKEIIFAHSKYPLGVCLRNDIHVLFHNTYGYGDNLPEQFYDFVDKINSGIIKINQ